MSNVLMNVKDSKGVLYLAKNVFNIYGAEVYECYDLIDMKTIKGYVAIILGKPSSLCENGEKAAKEISVSFENHKIESRPTLDIEKYYTATKKGIGINASGFLTEHTK